MVTEKTNILDVIPALHEDVNVNKGKEGELTLSFPALRKKGFWGFISKWSKTKHIELDMTGSEVVKQIDGKRNIEEIIAAMSAYFECKDNYAERIIMFISGLKAQGAIKYMAAHKNMKP